MDHDGDRNFAQIASPWPLSPLPEDEGLKQLELIIAEKSLRRLRSRKRATSTINPQNAVVSTFVGDLPVQVFQRFTPNPAPRGHFA
jgi:hypothetical protein